MKKIRTLWSVGVFCVGISSLFFLQACDDDETKDTQSPEISFTNLTEDMTVWNAVEIAVEATDDHGVASVEVFIGDESIDLLTETPFETTWHSDAFADGEHIIKAVVTDKSGNKTEAQITVNVLNTLVTLTMKADQLDDGAEFTEHGFIFLSDENGNVIADVEYQNGETIVLKSTEFNGEKFFLTEALVDMEPGEEPNIDLWTFAEIERGKNWVVLDDREFEEDGTYVGDANLTFTNPAANSNYFARSNGDEAYADESNLTSSIRIRKSPSKLYVVRESDVMVGPDLFRIPTHYNLYDNITVGANTINLIQTNKAITKGTVTVPQGSIYSSTDISGYLVANNYTEPYSVGYSASGTGITSYNVYYPGNAFASYYSYSDYETDDIYYERGMTSATPTFPMITNDVDLTFANSKLTYTATGNMDFISTGFESDDERSYWAYIFPAGANKVIPRLQLPDNFPVFDVPPFAFPEHYIVYDSEEVTGGYEGMKTYIRNSTRSLDGLFFDGKNYVQISYKDPVPGGGRSKRENIRSIKTFSRKK